MIRRKPVILTGTAAREREIAAVRANGAARFQHEGHADVFSAARPDAHSPRHGYRVHNPRVHLALR